MILFTLLFDSLAVILVVLYDTGVRDRVVDHCYDWGEEAGDSGASKRRVG